MFDGLKHRWRYRRTWSNAVGRDCIELDQTLCRWLGERLVFLAQHCNTCPAHAKFYPADMQDAEYFSYWLSMLKQHGAAILAYATADSEDTTKDPQAALRFVADHLTVLWD